MLLKRSHDFQVFISPKNEKVTEINPPSFNWPQEKYEERYLIELESVDKKIEWKWENISSPFQIPFTLGTGEYRWRLKDTDNHESKWFTFTVDETSENYLAPTAKDLFDLAKGRSQFLMYFDEDINLVQTKSQTVYEKLKKTASKVDIDKITYPTHYRRGEEEGKRKAINNVREWIDRDLVSLALLYKVWDESASGDQAVKLLLRLAEWSPEGPASLVRPLTWGDEVGLSLSRNLYLVYHWLSPLLTESEKNFVRPMLIRIAYQMEERLEQDKFKQYPGHSHTSRLPAYLGVAALTLHKEFDVKVCERWLDYSLMIYRGVLPFYGGSDGSWAEGPFYSSSYSKWQHPFFLTVERLSDFSFYNHPFYKNYYKFAMDFVAADDKIHPFGDGFWCKRDGSEWPGFFAQNPLRIYADRFGDKASKEMSRSLEDEIEWYQLHLLDVIPTINQLEFSENQTNLEDSKILEDMNYSKYYSFAGLGKISLNETDCYFRASQFGNSSHRHADQGNIALIDSGKGVLTPSGSYGYRFGSGHHNEWTRTTRAHNLPLIGGLGQILDDESATAKVLIQKSGSSWNLIQLDLTKAYQNVDKFIRNIILVQDKGLVVCDSIQLPEANSVQWRLHSHSVAVRVNNTVKLKDKQHSYEIKLHSHKDIKPELVCGYEDDNSHGEKVISDAKEDVYHMEWDMKKKKEHLIVACCEKSEINCSIEENGLVKIDVGDEEIILDIPSI